MSDLYQSNFRALKKKEQPGKDDHQIPSYILDNIKQVAAIAARNGVDLAATKTIWTEQA